MTRTLPASDYRKRPVTVKVAGPLSKDNCVAIARWCGGWTHIANTLVIPTLEGDMHASFGDWIIQGVAGEFYPCKPEIFAKTYEPATAHETTPSDAAIGQAFREALARTSLPGAPGPFVRSVLGRAREIEQGRGAVADDAELLERVRQLMSLKRNPRAKAIIDGFTEMDILRQVIERLRRSLPPHGESR